MSFYHLNPCNASYHTTPVGKYSMEGWEDHHLTSKARRLGSTVATLHADILLWSLHSEWLSSGSIELTQFASRLITAPQYLRNLLPCQQTPSPDPQPACNAWKSADHPLWANRRRLQALSDPLGQVRRQAPVRMVSRMIAEVQLYVGWKAENGHREASTCRHQWLYNACAAMYGADYKQDSRLTLRNRFPELPRCILEFSISSLCPRTIQPDLAFSSKKLSTPPSLKGIDVSSLSRLESWSPAAPQGRSITCQELRLLF